MAVGAIFGAGRMRRLPGVLPKSSAHLPLVMRPANGSAQARRVQDQRNGTDT